MIVRVRLSAEYRDLAPAGKDTLVVDMPVGATVREVLGYLKISADTPEVLLADGPRVGPDHTLRDGDVISVSPAGS